MKKGFTLIEMLVTIGIIAALMAASFGGYSMMTRAAEKARAQDLVQQVALALMTMYEDNKGVWPKRLALVGEKGAELDPDRAYEFVSGAKKYLSLSASGGKTTGYDRFGILSPWGVAILKRRGANAQGEAIKHRLWFAVDEDGDGMIKGVSVGGEPLEVRATAIVWCAGKDGKMEPYSKGLRSGGVYSWALGQTKK